MQTPKLLWHFSLSVYPSVWPMPVLYLNEPTHRQPLFDNLVGASF